jgi:hypothetical protein
MTAEGLVPNARHTRRLTRELRKSARKGRYPSGKLCPPAGRGPFKPVKVLSQGCSLVVVTTIVRRGQLRYKISEWNITKPSSEDAWLL